MKKKILIVEDEESLLKLESILFFSRGYEVIAVADGMAALDVLARERVDLVLLDVMLPEIDGVEICRRIKESPLTRRIPVIMLTAKKNQEDMACADAVGADWYITKPFKSTKVIEVVERFINAKT
ncbi:MAG: response regulator [Thermodesulfobacteriota bacterium]|nr:response regulator [Thermodesulfobacteriota bacterium]